MTSPNTDGKVAAGQELRMFPFVLSNMHVTKLKAETHFPPHVQHVFQLYCVISGEVEYTFDEKTTVRLYEREAFLIPPGLRRSPRSSCSKGLALVILFRPQDENFKQQLTRYQLNETQFQCAKSLLQAELELQETYPLRMIRINALLLELLGAKTMIQLCGHWGRDSFSEKDSVLQKVEYAEELMRSNLKHPLPLSSLIRLVGVSRAVLERGFRKYRHISVMAKYRDIRLDAARFLLEQGRSISEAAFLTGFLTTQHFATAFRRRFHVVPSDI